MDNVDDGISDVDGLETLHGFVSHFLHQMFEKLR